MAMEIRDRVSAAERAEVARIVKRALSDGTLVRPSRCSWCARDNQGTIHAHHPDYARPLMVVWICGPCHREHHAKYADERRIAKALKAPVYVPLEGTN
jgi:hypothetical protein